MMRKWTVALAAGMLVAVLVPGLTAAQSADPVLTRAAASRAKGVDGAPVTVYEIADFQCPYCARFALEIFPLLDSAYVKTGRVKWVFVNLPLPMHRRAWVAAEAALCAGGVADRFWAMHDRLFATPEEWTGAADPAPVLARYAREAGVPESEYRRCVEEDRVATLLLDDVLNASSAGIQGTPTFFVGADNQRLVGMQPFEVWREVLDRAIEKASSQVRPPGP